MQSTYRFNIIYLTINNINFKKYIGKHETDNLNDGYIGSGDALMSAIKKYGKENFTYRIVYIFDNVQDMWLKEAELANDKWVARKDTYNLAPGGGGGVGKINKGKPKSEEHNKKNSEAHLGKLKGENNPMYSKHHSEETKKLMSKALLDRYLNRKGSFHSKHHSEETKKLISKAKENKCKGENNSMYGTHYMWIHSLKENKNRRVKPSQLQDYLNEGWIKGIKKF